MTTTYLLKEKYNWTDSDIDQFIKGKKIPSNNIQKDILLLKSGYPLAYIIGYIEFLGCKVDLRYKPLIPRPETEYWVDKVIKQIHQNTHILDIFCGSGCVGKALLKHIQNIRLTCADVDTSAIKQTKYNLSKYPRAKIIKSNLFENIKGDFDYIFANPPYVGIKDRVGEETAYEPKSALYAGEDGLDIITKFLQQAHKYLKPSGIIYMEFGAEQKDKVRSILKRQDYKSCRFYKDQFQKWRWVEIMKPTS